MALVTANGFGVTVADFVLPISRAWTVDMTIACTDASQINGAVTISIGDGALTMKGTAEVKDVYLDTVRARVVAGAAGLAKTATPKFYQQASAKIILSDLLQTAGETMSSTADVGVLGSVLATWTVSKMPVADAIGLLMKQVGASWRMLTDGTFWCGHETWPDSGLTFTVEHEDKAHQQLIVTLEAPLILPGTAINGRNVSYVETHVDHKTVKSTVWAATAQSYDRMRDPMVAMVKTAVPQIDYLGLYRAQVVSQSGQTFDLTPDDPRLPSSGFKAVPIRHGLPGVSVMVPTGTYVLVGWMNGDQSKPYCALWDGGEAPTQIVIKATTVYLGDSSGTDALVKKSEFNAHTHSTTVAQGTSAPGAITSTPPSSPATGTTKVQAA